MQNVRNKVGTPFEEFSILHYLFYIIYKETPRFQGMKSSCP